MRSPSHFRTQIAPLTFLALLGSAGSAWAQPAQLTHIQAFDVTEQDGVELTDYQVKVIVDTATLIGDGDMKADGGDIRFGTDCSGGTQLDYYLGEGINTATTSIYVQIPTIPANGTTRFYLYYGNNSFVDDSDITIFSGPHSAIQGLSTGATQGSADRQRGSSYRAQADVLVTQFGKREPNGTTRYLTLFDVDTQSIIHQNQVAGAVAGVYTYQDVTPIWLTGGKEYLISIFLDTGDNYYNSAGDTSAGPGLEYVTTRWCNTCTKDTYPTNTTTGHFGYPDMTYYHQQVVTTVPVVTPVAVCAESATCNPDCTAARCGDSYINASAGEDCDLEEIGGATCGALLGTPLCNNDPLNPDGDASCTLDAPADGCTDPDQCADETDDCDDNATCENLPVGWECTCNEGFSGNGQVCTEDTTGEGGAPGDGGADSGSGGDDSSGSGGDSNGSGGDSNGSGGDDAGGANSGDPGGSSAGDEKGGSSGDESGCGCRTTGQGGPRGGLALLFAGLLLAGGWRRRAVSR